MSDEHPRRRAGVFRPAVPWFFAALLVTSLGLPAAAALGRIPAAPMVGYARPIATNESLAMNLTDAPAFAPQFVNAPSNSTLNLHLLNVGIYAHTFTLSATSDARLAPNATPAQVYSFFKTNGSIANVSVAPGGQGWANLTFNASTGFDSFEFASVVPYQFQAGMWGLLNITSTAPGLLASDNTTDHPSFEPNILSASPSKFPVRIDVSVTNLGVLGHTFTLAPQTNVTVPASFDSYFAQYPPLANVQVPAVTGQSIWANFTISAPGVYMYICEITGHYSSGMYGLLYVGVPVPAQPAAPSTAIVDTWVLEGSAVLLVIGVVLAGVASLVGRFPKPPRTGPSAH